MSTFKTKTFVVVSSILIVTATASVAVARYAKRDKQVATETSVVKTIAPEVTRELQHAPEESTTVEKPTAAHMTYEEQAEYLRANQQERDQMNLTQSHR